MLYIHTYTYYFATLVFFSEQRTQARLHSSECTGAAGNQTT